MTLSERLNELKKAVGTEPTSAQLAELFDLTARLAERLALLEDLASERRLDCEELFARCDGMEDDLRELAGQAGYDVGDELTADELDEGMSETLCESCGTLVLAHSSLEGDEACCPNCGEPLQLGDRSDG